MHYRPCSGLAKIRLRRPSQAGSQVEKGKSFGSVDRSRRFDLYSQVTGSVTKSIRELEAAPERSIKMHTPRGLKVEITDPASLDGLLTAEEYEAYAKEETH